MIRILTLIIALTAITAGNVYSGGFSIQHTDAADYQVVGVFDLRDRESFIQLTNTDSSSQTIHIQLFNVDDNCNENNFFDTYTPNDTHIYNIRDLVTNDGNPSGIVLPDNAYGIFVATYLDDNSRTLIGNLRIEDINGYEYRTNLNGTTADCCTNEDVLTFNYNNENGVILSDVFGFDLTNAQDSSPPAEVFAADITSTWVSFDIDIYDLNEVPFSCRNVVFACTDQDNPLLEALLEEVSNSGQGAVSVGSFEFGINEALPSSKNAPLLCPNNVISNGFVRMSQLDFGDNTSGVFALFVGLNNGNGRGSMDSLWYDSILISFED